MKMDPEMCKNMRMFFDEDCLDTKSGTRLTERSVKAKFAVMENGLAAVFTDGDYTNGPRPGDRWALSYHATVIASGTIGLRDHGEDVPKKDRYAITVTDLGTQRTFTEVPFKSWIDDTFCNMLCARVGTGAGQGADRDMCLKKIPWRRVGIVHLGLRANLNAILTQHKSCTDERERSTQKRKRLNIPTAADPPEKRAACSPPAEMPSMQLAPATSPALDVDDYDEQCTEPAQLVLALSRESPVQAHDDVGMRRAMGLDNPFREVFEHQAQLSRLMAEQMAENAELAKTNRDYAAQLQQQLRAKQCLELEVSALRRCEREVAQKYTALQSSGARDYAQIVALQTRITCLEREAQANKAVMRSMEIETAGLYKFLEEATRAAGRISNAYKTDSHASSEF
jgi:hypothetical protein